MDSLEGEVVMKFKQILHSCVIDFGTSLGRLEELTRYFRAHSGIDGGDCESSWINRYNQGKLLLPGIAAIVSLNQFL